MNKKMAYSIMAAAIGFAILAALGKTLAIQLQDAIWRWEGYAVRATPTDISRYDLVPGGSGIARASVRLRNLLPAKVRVEGVRVSCGCTTPDAELPVLIAPGGEAEFPFDVIVAENEAEGSHRRTETATFFLDVSCPEVQVRFHF